MGTTATYIQVYKHTRYIQEVCPGLSSGVSSNPIYYPIIVLGILMAILDTGGIYASDMQDMIWGEPDLAQ